ncbi:ABC transporter transmembrane domain-containing protein [Alicyclobacillus sp. SO9]|uniref:ABC transporter transmembrane domain-containing protein n=1 Tax=Alicyclobacillus sp. SO9 TaxID=2665646 RepID=UPI0018E7DD15|nr:ABC transporter transmembrane domain-containing protein [Alicyclobacillus sp. SO9]QQE76814.1 ATP-binding cassette domain-containing protein [Alicyclobacillus sp. SO9]
MRVFWDLMWYFKANKWRYMSGIFLLILVALLNLIPPQIVGSAVDKISKGTLTPVLLLRWILYIAGTGVLIYVLRFFWRVMLFGAAIKLSTILRSRLYAHFSKMSPQFYHNRRIGDLMAHSTNDIQAIEQTGTDGILTLVDSITTGTVVTATMAFTLSWKLTLVALAPMPFMALLTSYYGKLMHRHFHKAQAAFADLNDKVQENISGVRVIKAFGQEESENSAFQAQSQDVVDKNMAVAKIDALFDPTIGIVVAVSFFLTVSIGSLFVIHGRLSIGQLTTFTMYLGQLIWPMLAFGWLFNIVERGRASYDRVRKLLSVQPDIVNQAGASQKRPSGDLNFSIDSFAYPNSHQSVLTDILVQLQKGKTLGLVGKTGAGKTTLLKLLLREFDCHSGDIVIGGQSIYDVTLDALRASIAYVPQDHFLFSATIRENIAFGKPAAATEEIYKAASIAAVHQDILGFADGYDTLVGERGVTLSGGQKQRISIARALLLDSEILVLDDCLSAVDAKTENEILQSLTVDRVDRTTIITAHRLSAVQHADVIVVLSDGAILEQGNHEELMRQGGWYCQMYRQQQLESLIEEGGRI